MSRTRRRHDRPIEKPFCGTSDFCPRRRSLAHESRARAKLRLRKLNGSTGFKGFVFRCRHCGRWHVGKVIEEGS